MTMFPGEVFGDERTWYALGSKGKKPDAAFLVWLRSQPCCSCKRLAVAGVFDVVPHHIRRVHYAHNPRNKRSGRCGTGLKPEFCSVPLCVDCHERVEGHGSDAVIADEQQWEVWRWFYPTLWAAGALLKTLGYRSWSAMDRSALDGWLTAQGIYHEHSG